MLQSLQLLCVFQLTCNILPIGQNSQLPHPLHLELPRHLRERLVLEQLLPVGPELHGSIFNKLLKLLALERIKPIYIERYYISLTTIFLVKVSYPHLNSFSFFYHTHTSIVFSPLLRIICLSSLRGCSTCKSYMYIWLTNKETRAVMIC